MPYNILILGGSRFHGYLLAEQLNSAGHSVTVLNRGNFRTEWPDGVRHIRADRNNIAELRERLAQNAFEIVFDNNAYNSQQVSLLAETLPESVQQYVLTSTSAVYMRHVSATGLCEDAADASCDALFHPQVVSYARNKLAAEAAVRHHFPDIHTILRFPNIFGAGDFAGKVQYFDLRLADGKGILLEDDAEPFSLIWVDDAVRAMLCCIDDEQSRATTLNVADPRPHSYDELFESIFHANYAPQMLVRAPTPWLRERDFRLPFAWSTMLDGSKTAHWGLSFSPPSSWGPEARDWSRTNPGSTMQHYHAQRPGELALIAEFSATPK